MNRSAQIPVIDRPPARLTNAAASIAVVALAVLIYWAAPYNRKQMDALYGSTAFSFTGAEFLLAGATAYAVLLTAFYLALPQPVVSKSLRFLRVVAATASAPRAVWRQGVSKEDRLAVLVTLLKAFFGPLMAMSLMIFCVGALAHGMALAQSGALEQGFTALFDGHGFWFLMKLIVFIDVLVFTVGYLVDLPQLKNDIRSVDPTLFGWAVALACYPPFNHATGAILGWQVSDFPQFDDPTAHLALNLLLLALMAIYTWASVALGLKASNLTHRGIIARGPYAVIRHPAYVCKNLAWWIGSIPMVSAAFGHSLLDGIQAIASVVGWSMIYILRAQTEEDHLRSVDGEYAAYAARVRYRFIPGVV